MPVSIELRNADTAVITPIMENTPMVMPDIVKKERSLFTPSEPRAMRRISIKDILFIAQSHHRIEPGGSVGG